MSLAALAWAFNVRGLKPNEKLVLLYACNAKGEDDWYWRPFQEDGLAMGLPGRDFLEAVEGLHRAKLMSPVADETAASPPMKFILNPEVVP